MRRFALSIFLVFALFCGHAVSAYAQSESDSVTVNTENIGDLIGTLENKPARDEFIKNLKALQTVQEQQKKQELEIPVLSEKLGIGNASEKFIEKYEKFLTKHNLKSSTFGKFLATFVASLVAVILLFANYRLGMFIRQKLVSLNNNMRLHKSHFRLYSRIVRFVGYYLIVMLYIFTMNAIWKIADLSFLQAETMGNFFGTVGSVVMIVAIGAVVWEVINAMLERSLRKAGEKQSSRMQTVLPLVRNVMFMVFLLLFSLILLSELGINILPLLAGAGVLGIAIGFGAQTMVKDFITGFTIILEDLIQVGDVVTLSGYKGTVEKITMRKVQLRMVDGVVVTVPFSNISIVENTTKLFSFFVFDLGVAYKENTDSVIELIKQVAAELRQDPVFKAFILDDAEIFGVDRFADSAVVIKGRIKTKPSKQWDVGREFNRRIKFLFDARGIEIPFPHQTIYFGDKNIAVPNV